MDYLQEFQSTFIEGFQLVGPLNGGLDYDGFSSASDGSPPSSSISISSVSPLGPLARPIDMRKLRRYAKFEGDTGLDGDEMIDLGPREPLPFYEHSYKCGYTYHDSEDLPLPPEAFRPIPAETVQTRSVRTIPLQGFQVFGEYFTPAFSRNSLRLIYFRQPQAIGITFPWNNLKARVSAPARSCKINRIGENIHLFMPTNRARFFCADREKFATFEENEKLRNWCFDNMKEDLDGSTLAHPEFRGQPVIKWSCAALGCEKEDLLPGGLKANMISQSPTAKISAAKLAHQFCELCVQHSAKLPPAPQQAPAQPKSYYHEPEVPLSYDDPPPGEVPETENPRHPDFAIITPDYIVPKMVLHRDTLDPPTADPVARAMASAQKRLRQYSLSPPRTSLRSPSPPTSGPKLRKLAEFPDSIRYRERSRALREQHRLNVVKNSLWDPELSRQRQEWRQDHHRLGRNLYEYQGRDRPAQLMPMRRTTDSYRPKRHRTHDDEIDLDNPRATTDSYRPDRAASDDSPIRLRPRLRSPTARDQERDYELEGMDYGKEAKDKDTPMTDVEIKKKKDYDLWRR